jgi:HEAT repeat protein
MLTLICVLVLSVAEFDGQAGVCTVVAENPVLGPNSAPDDPALALYKTGYASVLAKKWDESRKSFQLLLKKYPKSKYADQASYWLAYSYARTDSKKAIEYYRQFLATYPESPYISDAVADLEKLGYTAKEPPPAPPVPPAAYSVAAGQYEQQLQLKAEQERLQEEQAVVSASAGRRPSPENEVKIAAIEALSRNNEDAQAFETLKGIALDTTADWELRSTAVQALRAFKDRDLTPIFQTIIASGSTELRKQGIMSLVRFSTANDAKTTGILVKLAEDSREPEDLRFTAILALREMNYAGLVTVVEKIVTNDTNLKMRREGLLVLSRVEEADKPKALNIFKSVASNSAEAREIREGAIIALAEVRDRQAFEILKGIVLSEPDKKLRQTALYALGRNRGDLEGEIVALIKEVALRSAEDREIRIAALFALSERKTGVPTDFFVDLVAKEKDEEIRKVVVQVLSRSIKDKTAAFNTLSGIYGNATGSDRKVKEAALYGIAELGNAQAVSFLKNVATTEQDQDLRRTAVYFLGSIGGEDAKAVLIEILKKK